jgi:hypothetical protein
MNGDASMFVHQHHFGISRQVQHLVDDAAIWPRQTRCFAWPAAGFAAKAKRHPPSDAIFTLAAKRAQAKQREVMSEQQRETKNTVPKERLAKGGSVSSASRRADGIATKGKTRGKMC